LDYADDKYSKEEISGIKSTLKVLLIFVPVPVFWALFDQQVRKRFLIIQSNLIEKRRTGEII
jgi:dipeptide/tripeptide permease